MSAASESTEAAPTDTAGADVHAASTPNEDSSAVVPLSRSASDADSEIQILSGPTVIIIL